MPLDKGTALIAIAPIYVVVVAPHVAESHPHGYVVTPRIDFASIEFDLGHSKERNRCVTTGLCVI